MANKSKRVRQGKPATRRRRIRAKKKRLARK